MKTLLTSVCLLASISSNAQKIDFNLSGKESQSTETDYTSWAIGRQASDTKTVDGVTIKASAVSGIAGNAVFCNWWKDGVNKYDKLISDGIYPIILDSSNNYSYSSDTPMGVQFDITGLAAGEHTLCAYHNNTDGTLSPGYPKLKVAVNGEVLSTGVVQTIRATKASESGMSYVRFTVKEGETVTVQYISETEAGASYINTSVVVNALIFDRPNPKATATDPYPANLDMHADCDDGGVTLTWKSEGEVAKHHVLLGTSTDDLKEVGVTTEGSYTVTDRLSDLNTYYWRVDEEDAEGNRYEGDVWSFRPRHLAFPGAEGYGRFAIGGRGGSVYHVTSLDDDVDNPQPGTFRYGIKNVSGPRTIVFDVAGYITLQGRLTCSDPYVTIAGQTAPGKGIIFRGAPVGFASDGITRFIRNHRGYASTEDDQNKGLDGIGMAGNDNAIVDHCSISWTTDEGFSSRGAKSITLQHTMITEALNCADHPNYAAGTCHGYAATIGGGQGSGVGSFHHNLLAHCEGRNWSLSGGLTGAGAYDGAHDVFNNVVYNWGGRATDGGSHEVNFVGNYYKMGPATTQQYLFRHQFEGTGTGSQSAYVSGNIRENLDGTKTQDAENVTYRYELSGNQQLTWSPWASEPYFPSYANVETAEQAYMNVLSDVGCNQPLLDDHDVRMVDETYNGTTSTTGCKTGKKGLIDRESDAGGYETFESAVRNADFDTDQDGMPDWWERLNGLSVSAADNNSDTDGDGYTALEDYLNWMALPHFTFATGTENSIDLHEYFAGYPASAAYELTEGGKDVASITDGKLTVKATASDAIVSIPVKASANGASLTRTFNFHFDASATGIIQITDCSSSARAYSPSYNMAGQRVGDNYRGIVIRNGKVVREVVREVIRL